MAGNRRLATLNAEHFDVVNLWAISVTQLVSLANTNLNLNTASVVLTLKL